MKRAAQLLLLLLASWLLSAAPSARFVNVAPAAPPALSSEERARSSVEHAVFEVATLQVARAPLLARVPAPLPQLTWHERLLAPQAIAPPDRREALRRVQTRRRLPRLTPAEPPWC